MINGDKKVWCVCVFYFFKTSTAVCSLFIVTVFTIFPLLTHGLQAYSVAIARLIVAFYPDKTCLSIIAFGDWGAGGKQHDFVGESVICARYQRGL